jgi:putative pyrroloquinoline-quinone-binding quinoprotein
MKELLLQTESGSTQLKPAERQVQPVPPSFTLIPLAPDGAEYRQPFANAQLNSRVGFALPSKKWSVLWKADLHPSFVPSWVLQGGNRILVQAGEFRLFDLEGRKIAADRAGSAPMFLDREKGLFYGTVPTGYFAANQLAKGTPAYLFLPALGDSARRILIARKEKRLLIAGVERPVDPHGHVKPTRSVIQVTEIKEPVRTAGPGLLQSGKPLGELYVASPELMAAAGPDQVVFTTPRGIFLADWDLKVRAVVRGAFKVRRFSLGELGGIYLIVQLKTGLEFWLLNREGGRIYSVTLPPEFPEPPIPPLIGYDHRAYLVASNRITTISDRGDILWSYEASAPIAGAIVTANKRVLLCEGSRIVALNPANQSEVLATLPGTLIAAPVLTSEGAILAIADKTLYCLTGK